MRWQHPERGLLDPGEFIPVAEDSGLIEPIGRWVRRGLPPGARLARAAPRRAALSTSRSTSRPARSPTATWPRASARSSSTGLDPVHLRLEVTESVLVEERRRRRHPGGARELGVGLVLDDFGTGYSSLAYLNRFPLDALKIDRSFVDALGVEQERTAIVEAIIGMARALALDVVAEGVENEASSELRRLGCDYAQGFFFSRPLPAEQISNLLAEARRLLGDPARQVVVAEHLRRARQRVDQSVVAHPADELLPARRGSCSRRAAGPSRSA